MLRSQEVTNEDILSAIQKAEADERKRARSFSKRSIKKGNHAGSEFGFSDFEKNICCPESSKVVSELIKALSPVIGQLAVLRKYVDVLKTQGCNPVRYPPNRCGYKSCIEQNVRQRQQLSK